MRQELYHRAREEYLNAIIFYKSGCKNHFYRYLGAGEAYERMLRENYNVTEEEDKGLCELSDICDAFDDAE